MCVTENSDDISHDNVLQKLAEEFKQYTCQKEYAKYVGSNDTEYLFAMPKIKRYFMTALGIDIPIYRPVTLLQCIADLTNHSLIKIFEFLIKRGANVEVLDCWENSLLCLTVDIKDLPSHKIKRYERKSQYFQD
ncbi:hypothetical protein BIY23_01705 [Wolbachia pipientis]|uniref:Ankyrin repeat domain-containing protein n=1 Tax=Wolbachia pipientis TaxID=955 RepID=A0A1E7QL23_WOLPI|nr:hypothetical protein [Wolbachia pipientis]OEY87172.1 hypothetical protein BIY23_01705 [Wolbachia pipientis]